MARFVSHYKGYTYGVRRGKEPYLGPTGTMVPGTTDLEAEFTHDLMDDEAIRLAKLPRAQGGLASDDPTKPAFHGMTQNESGRDNPIEPRLALFDSEIAALQHGWADDETALVLKALRESPRLGTDFVEVTPTPVELPWPGYDNLDDAEKIAEIAGLIDADVNKVIAYEKENKDRPLVLTELSKVSDEQQEIVVSA